MNEMIKNWAENERPKVETLSLQEKNFYRFGLMILSSFVSEDFLDVPLLPTKRFETNGLFYTIPYLHDDMLWSSRKERTLLVVWEVKDRTSFCPLRIEVVLKDNDDYQLVVHDQ